MISVCLSLSSLETLFVSYSESNPNLDKMSEALPFLAFISVIILIVGGMISLFRKNQKRKRKIVALEEELNQFRDQLQNLEYEQSRFQLNPHLFRNTLNTLQNFSLKTHESIERLSSLLDYVLYDSLRPYVALKEELTFLRDFLDFSAMNAHPAFEVSISNQLPINDPVLDKELVAPMMTAYFVENAFKHTNLEDPTGFIRIHLELTDNQLVYSVANSQGRQKGNGQHSSRGGLGRQNLEQRLRVLYPNCHHLNYEEAQEVFTAYLKIDLNGFQTQVHPAR